MLDVRKCSLRMTLESVMECACTCDVEHIRRHHGEAGIIFAMCSSGQKFEHAHHNYYECLIFDIIHGAFFLSSAPQASVALPVVTHARTEAQRLPLSLLPRMVNISVIFPRSHCYGLGFFCHVQF